MVVRHLSCPARVLLAAVLLVSTARPAAADWNPSFGFFSAGRPGGWRDCVQIIEAADPHTWNDNYFCSTESMGWAWSSAGSIGGMKNTHIYEAADPHTWNDNYLAVPSNSPLTFHWSSAGAIGGLPCSRWYEAADPHTWGDNYLCWTITESPCGRGQYWNYPNLCYSCPATQYQDSSSHKSRSCKTTQPGYYQDQGGQGGQKPCSPGNYQNSGSQTGCKQCGATSYQDQWAQSGCKGCPGGTFQDQSGQSGCKACDFGKYQNSGSQSSCKVCGAGQYQDQTGQTSCKGCPLGSYSNAQARTCSSCPGGTYSTTTGDYATSCKACSPGTYRPTAGFSSCLSCPASKFQDQSGQTACKDCVPCPDGQYWPAGCSSTTGYTCATCRSCPTGTYRTGGCLLGQDTQCTTCTPCPAGTTRTGGCVSTTDSICTDITPPSISCPASTTLQAAAFAPATASFSFSATASDTGPVAPTVVCTHNSAFKFPIGDTTVTCTATDGASNQRSCSFTITVVDVTPPAITCPSSMIIPTADTAATGSPNFSATASDNATPSPAIVCSPPSLSAFALGATSVTCTATDTAQLSSSCSFTVTVQDKTPPVITSCPGDVSADAPSTGASKQVAFATPTATDNVTPASAIAVACSPPSMSSFAFGATPVTCTATDGAGNKQTCSLTVTITDSTHPEITCPTSQTTSATASSASSAAFTYPAPVVKDNVDSSPTVACDPPVGSTFALGSSTVSCTATDHVGLASTCSFTVTVNDVTPPVLTCPDQTVTASSTGPTTAFTPAPVASDNSGAAPTVTCTSPFSSTGLFPIGTTTIDCLAADAAGNENTCTFTLTVKDTTAPTLTSCPGDFSVPLPPNPAEPKVAVPLPMPTYTDNAATALTITSSPVTDSELGLGAHTVSYTATDASGNTNTACSLTVTVVDITPPRPSCTTDFIEVATASTTNTAVIDWSLAVSAEDNSFVAPTITCTPTKDSPIPITTPPNLNRTVVCVAADAAGNRANCSFTVRVVDDTPPVFTTSCPPNTVLPTDPDKNSTVFTYPQPVAVDNVAILTAPQTTPSPAVPFPLGETVLTFTATDTALNTQTCTSVITVVDRQPPTFAAGCPAQSTLTIPTDPDLDLAVITLPVIELTDNSDPPADLLLDQYSIPAGFAAPKTAIPANLPVEIVSRAEDGSGNVNWCNYTVLVVDRQPPTISNCPANIVAPTRTALSSTLASWAEPTALDNVDGPLADGVTTSAPTPGLGRGDAFPLGTTTITITFTDKAGNSDACMFNITIFDNQPPQLTCPSNIVTRAASAADTTAIVAFNPPKVEDNANANTTVVRALPAVTCDHSPTGSAFPLGVTRVECRAEDAAGNNATCDFSVVVNHANSPSIRCPDNVRVSTSPDLLTATNVFWNSSDPAVLDCDHANGTAFPLGTTHVLCENAGGSSTPSSYCSFSVVVVDLQSPVLTCPPSLRYAVPLDQYEWVSPMSFPPGVVATDNNPTHLETTCDLALGETFAIGLRAIKCTATDGSSLPVSCFIDLIIADDQPPAIECPRDRTADDALILMDGATAEEVVFALPPASDNSLDTPYVSCTPRNGTLLPVNDDLSSRTHTVNCTARDLSNNTAWCAFDVQVVQPGPPVMTCAAEAVAHVSNGVSSARVTFPAPSAESRYGTELAVQCSHSSGDRFPAGVNTTVQCNATDEFGATSTCDIMVRVEQDCFGRFDAWSRCSQCPDPDQQRVFLVERAPTGEGQACPDTQVRACNIACRIIRGSLLLSAITDALLWQLQQNASLSHIRTRLEAYLRSQIPTLEPGTLQILGSELTGPLNQTLRITYAIHTTEVGAADLLGEVKDVPLNNDLIGWVAPGPGNVLSNLDNVNATVPTIVDTSNPTSGSSSGGSSAGFPLLPVVIAVAVVVLVVVVAVVVVLRRQRHTNPQMAMVGTAGTGSKNAAIHFANPMFAEPAGKGAGAGAERAQGLENPMYAGEAPKLNPVYDDAVEAGGIDDAVYEAADDHFDPSLYDDLPGVASGSSGAYMDLYANPGQTAPSVSYTDMAQPGRARFGAPGSEGSGFGFEGDYMDVYDNVTDE